MTTSINKERILISLQITIIILFSIINIIPDIYDRPRSSMMLSISYIGILMMVTMIITKTNKEIRITSIDILLFISIILYTLHLKYIDLWTICLYCLLLIYIVLRLSTKINYLYIYFLLLAATFILSVIGYLQCGEVIRLTDDKYPITGEYYNSAIYGGILCFLFSALFPFLLSSSTSQIPRYLKYVSIAIILFSTPALIISNSRASWLALTFAIIYMIFIKYRSRISKINLKYKLLFLVPICTILIFSTYCLYQMKPDSAQGRILIWKVSIHMIKDKPLTGFGKNGFSAKYMHYQAEYLKSKGTEKEKYLAANNHLVYNEPIRIMVEYGIGGILLYLIFIYVIFIRNKRFDIVTLTLKSFFTAFLVWGFFSYPDKIFPVLLYLIIALAFLANREPHTLSFQINSFSIQGMKIIGLVCSIILFSQLFIQHKAFYRFNELQINKSLIIKEVFSAQLAALEPIMTHDIGFVAYYTSELFKTQQDDDSLFIRQISNWEKQHSVNELYIMKGDYLLQKKQFTEAETNYRLAHYMVPSRQKARVRLAFLYREWGKKDKAEEIANEVLTEDVKVYGFETYRLHEELEKAFRNN